MSEGKVRILADVIPKEKKRLEEVCKAMDITKKAFFLMCIDKYYKQKIEQGEQ